MKSVIKAGIAGVATGALVLLAVVLLAPLPSIPTSSPQPSSSLVASPPGVAFQVATTSLPPATPSSTASAPPTSSSTPGPPAVGTSIGQVAPDFELPSLDGTIVHLSDFRGHPVWVNFWASWCPPCRDEMPRLEAVYLSYRADGLVILGVTVRDSPADAAAFVREVGVTYPIVLDEPGKVADEYHGVALPVQYWIDREGIIRDWAFGELPPNLYDSVLAKILPARSAAP